MAQKLSLLAPTRLLLVAIENEAGGSLLQRLDPPERAKVLMALLGLVILGCGMAGGAWILGRYVRRISRKPLGQSRVGGDDWFRKPLNSGAGDPPEGASHE